MAGIVGLVTKNDKRVAVQELEEMLRTLRHERSYEAARISDSAIGVYAASLNHPKSICTTSPLSDKKGRYVLLFSGEEFSGLLTPSQEQSRLSADCGEELGQSFLRRLNGWYSGIWVDSYRNETTLFNDRFGMERVYFYEGSNAFYFASEAKALLALHPQLREIDPQGLAELITCDTVLEGRTLFPRIGVLPPGAAWRLRPGESPRRETYFSLAEWEEVPEVPRDSFYPILTETFDKVLPRYLAGDEPVALSLTAGLDTRMIIACLSKKNVHIPCYTFGGSQRDTLDIKIAREIAAALNLTHDTLRIDASFFKEFPELARQTVFITEGHHDVCGAHDLFFNHLAKDSAPVRLTGKFGSEVLRTRRMMAAYSPKRHPFSADIARFLNDSRHTIRDAQGSSQLSYVVFKELPWHEYGRLKLERTVLKLRTPYMDNHLVQLMFQSPAGLRESNDLQYQYIWEHAPALRPFITNRGTAGAHGRTISWLLQGLFLLTHKAEYLYLFEFPSVLARADSVITRLGLDRRLIGLQKFEHYRIWFRRELAEFVADTLLSEQCRSRPCFDGRELSRMVTGHIAGKGNYFPEIAKALTIELLYETLLDWD